MNETFGQRLRRIRKAKKFTQIALAKRVGIANARICEYEYDRHVPNIVVLEWLCKALGVTATEMLGF